MYISSYSFGKFKELYQIFSDLSEESLAYCVEAATKLISEEKQDYSLRMCIFTLISYFHIVRHRKPSISRQLLHSLDAKTNCPLVNGDYLECFDFRVSHPAWEDFESYDYMSIEDIIERDDIDAFIRNSQNKKFIHIPKNELTELFHRNDFKQIELCAYYGSTKCFNFLQCNGCILDESISRFAICSINHEIEKKLIQNNIVFRNCIELAFIFVRGSETYDMLVKKYANNINDICAYRAISSSSIDSVSWLIQKGYSNYINMFLKGCVINHYNILFGFIIDSIQESVGFKGLLKTAVKMKNTNVASFILDSGDFEVDDCLLTEACVHEEYNLMLKMLDRGFKITSKCVEMVVKRGKLNIAIAFFNKDHDCFSNSNCVCIAAKNGDKAMLDFLLSSGVDPSKGTPSPLFIACYNNNYEAVKMLMSTRTPLKDNNLIDMLIENNNIQMLKYIINLRYALSEYDIQKCIFKSIENCKIEDIQFFINTIEERDTVLENCLGHSCKFGSIDIIKYFLDEGAPFQNAFWADIIKRDRVDILELLYCNPLVHKPKGNSLIRYACYSNSSNLIKFLAKHDEDVNAIYEDGTTPILISCEFSSEALVRSLIDLGANINALDKDNNDIFHYSVRSESSLINEFLLSITTYKDRKNIIGETALHVACRYDRDINNLLKHGADINAKDDCGNSPLHTAAMFDSIKNVTNLISLGVSTEIKNSRGQTPLHIACENGSCNAIEYLLQASANINARDQYDNTPIHIACIKQQLLSLKKLIAHKAELEVYNRDGLTPKMIVVNLLWQEGQQALEIEEEEAQTYFDNARTNQICNYNHTSKAQMHYKMMQLQTVFKRSYLSKDNIIYDRLKRVVAFLREYDNVNMSQLAIKTGIDPRTLKKIKEYATNNDDDNFDPFNNQSINRRSMSIRLEKSIAFYIRNTFIKQNLHFNDRMCYKIAMRFWNKYTSEHIRNDFKCSLKWIYKFMQNYGFSKRKCSNQKRPTIDAELKEKCIRFRKEIHEVYSDLAQRNKLHLLINADETAWRIALQNELTWANKGAKHVTNGIQYNEKSAVTALAAVSAQMEKLPLTVITKGIGIDSEKKFTNKNILTMHSHSGWTTEVVFFQWMSWIRLNINEHYPEDKYEKIHLLIDVYTTHITSFIKKVSDTLNIQLHYIPPGATDLMQPLDRYGFGALKKIAERIWNDFLIHNKKSKVTIVDAINILDQAWNELSTEDLEKQWNIYIDDTINIFEEEEENNEDDDFIPLMFPEEEDYHEEKGTYEDSSYQDDVKNSIMTRIKEYDTHPHRVLPTIAIQCADHLQNSIIQLLYSIPDIADNMNDPKLIQALFKIMDNACDEVNLFEDENIAFCQYFACDNEASLKQNIEKIFEQMHDVGIIINGKYQPIINIKKSISSGLEALSKAAYITKCVLFTSKNAIHLSDCPEIIKYGNHYLFLRGFLCHGVNGSIYFWRSANNKYYECNEAAIIEVERRQIKRNIAYVVYIPFISNEEVFPIDLLIQTYPGYQSVLENFINERELEIKEKKDCNTKQAQLNIWFKNETKKKKCKKGNTSKKKEAHFEEESYDSYEE